MSIRKHAIAILTGVLILAPGAVAAYTYEIELRSSHYVQRGRDFLKNGNIMAAIDQYEMGLKGGLGHSDLQDAHNDLCVAYYFLAEYERALAHCQEAIDLVPNHWVHYNNRANIFLMQGDLKRAKRDYQKALRLHPKSEVIARNISLADRIENGRNAVSRPTSTGKKENSKKRRLDRRPVINGLAGTN